TEYTSRFDRYRPQVRQRWREGAGPGAGLWYDLGPHVVDQALDLFGMPQAVSADLAIRREGGLAIDDALVLLHYPDKRVVLGAGMLVSGGTPRFLVHGTAASFIKQGLDAQEDQLKAGLDPRHADWGIDPHVATLFCHDGDTLVSEPVTLPRGAYQDYYAGVRDAVLGVGGNPVPAADAVRSMRVIEAAVRAAKSGKREKP
ncbi:MAG TPA: Gfo/Idh/MocA family oxidoreductase, partial [Chitinolyticbacter sp.]|nr:Gfo/Idh/MocA family oxidoreductase [Chitinolyticbacter sp.]